MFDLPTDFGNVYIRTIYLWHALALFTMDKVGYMKPTEGMSKNGYKRCKKVIEQRGGIWIWISSSAATDMDHKGKDKVSYIWGAVYVTEIIETEIFKKGYKRERLKGEYGHSKGYVYQCIIPDNRYCRRELPERVEVPKGDEMRLGVWMPQKDSKIYEELRRIQWI